MPREPEHRKSSIGSRRGPPKRHIPFRGDDLGLGKKTGIAVEFVAPNSDEFEPFEEVMKQADKRPRPQVKSTKKKKISLGAPVESDEDGEMSMHLAESNRGSPPPYHDDIRGEEDDAEEEIAQGLEEFDNDEDGNGEMSMDLEESNRGSPIPYAEVERDEEDDAEDEIAQRLEEVENDEEADGEAAPPSMKRDAEVKPKKPRGRRQKKENVVHNAERSPSPQGVRRGKRHRYQPLEYWRQERVVYGRRESGITLVPQIKEIIRVPKEPVAPLGNNKRKRKRSNNPRNPEEGWDDDTETMGIVRDYATRTDVERRIAWTAKMVDPKEVVNSDWLFQKIFGDGDFIAAGQLVIPPKSRKPSKGTKDNTYIFYVIEGAISLQINETNLVLATGGMFLVPRGNTYFIENICDRDAKLFFTQARKVPPEDEPVVKPPRASARPGRSTESVGPSVDPQGGRSSSAAPQQHKQERKGNRRAATTKV